MHVVISGSSKTEHQIHNFINTFIPVWPDPDRTRQSSGRAVRWCLGYRTYRQPNMPVEYGMWSMRAGIYGWMSHIRWLTLPKAQKVRSQSHFFSSTCLLELGYLLNSHVSLNTQILGRMFQPHPSSANFAIRYLWIINFSLYLLN